MGIGPIPWTAMMQWAEYHGLSRAVAQHTVTVLRLVDQETLRRAAAKATEPAPRKE